MDGRPRPCAFPEASPHVAVDTRRYRIRRLPRTPSASPGSLREQREGVDMARPDNREMPSIDRGNLGEIQAFGNGNPGGIDRTQRQIGVRPDQFGRWLTHFTARCLVPLDTLAWPVPSEGQRRVDGLIRLDEGLWDSLKWPRQPASS